jgi:hypothetical protein
MSVFTRLADMAQRGAVVGLLSMAGYQCYQIAKFTMEGRVQSPYMESTYFKDVEEKVKEEYRKDQLTDHRDWYSAEDSSYLKNQVRPNLTSPEYLKSKQNATKK